MSEYIRVPRNRPATISCAFGDETPKVADDDVTVSVVAIDGTEHYSGTADEDDGTYTYRIPGQDELNFYICRWTGMVDGEETTVETQLEVCGGYYFRLADVRKIQGFADAAKYPTSLLAEKRIEVEDEFEWACQRAFAPRYQRDKIEGNGGDRLMLSKPDVLRINNISIDGAKLSSQAIEALKLRWNWMGDLWRRDSAGWYGDIVVEYEHGKLLVPTDIKRVAKVRMRSLLMGNAGNIPDRATSITSGDQRFSLAMPGRYGYTVGIPEVDAVLDRYTLDTRGIW